MGDQRNSAKRTAGTQQSSDVAPTDGRGNEHAEEPRVVMISLDLIDSCPVSFDAGHDPKTVAKIAEDLRHGELIHPILVRPGEDGRFEAVVGRHRLEAVRQAGRKEILATVRDLDNGHARVASIVENFHRRVPPQGVHDEGIAALKELLEEQHGPTRRGRPPASPKKDTPRVNSTAAIAEKIGKSKELVRRTNRRQERLAPNAREALDCGKLKAGQADELTKLPPEKQVDLLPQVKGKTRDETRRLVAQVRAASGRAPKATVKTAARWIDRCAATAEKLCEQLTSATTEIGRLPGLRQQEVVGGPAVAELAKLLARLASDCGRLAAGAQPTMAGPESEPDADAREPGPPCPTPKDGSAREHVPAAESPRVDGREQGPSEHDEAGLQNAADPPPSTEGSPNPARPAPVTDDRSRGDTDGDGVEPTATTGGNNPDGGEVAGLEAQGEAPKQTEPRAAEESAIRSIDEAAVKAGNDRTEDNETKGGSMHASPARDETALGDTEQAPAPFQPVAVAEMPPEPTP